MQTIGRRQFLIGSAVVAGSAGLGSHAARAATTQAGAASAIPGGSADAVADTYYLALLKNTPVMESFWDPAIGAYSPASDSYIGIGGNAVLLNFGNYDAGTAGIDKVTLYDHTVRSITYYAAANYYNGGTVWGRPLFWNSTYAAYFGYAAFLMWDALTSQTHDQIHQLLAGTAGYDAQLGTADDPASPGWSTNGLAGGYQGDTKTEEMGNKGMAFAAALAYVPDNPDAPNWRSWLDTWSSNMTGFPVSDKNNATVVAGETVAQRNTAQNCWPGYIVENHGSYAPIYHESAFVYPARNAVGFLLTGQSIPDSQLAQPNGDGLYRTMRTLTSSAGISTYPMIADRFHLYGRDVLPLTGRYLLHGDALAGRAEQMLAQRLVPYVDYPPAGRLTKFSGQPSYEPEARAEVGMAYLLHYLRDRLPGGKVTPVSEAEFFSASSATQDWGPGVGLAGQQTSQATALAVTKPGFVKLAWLPGHDDWLFDPSGSSAFFTPSGLILQSRNVRLYSRARDGYDATATVLPAQYGVGDGGTDDLSFPAVAARYVRMLGVQPATAYGYSIYEFEVYGTASTANLALHMATTASSQYSAAYQPAYATDGDPSTRWAVSSADRSRPDSWLEVDLGTVQTVNEVVILWESAYGTAYKIQVSTDGTTWTDAATVNGFAGGIGGYLGFATLPDGSAVYATTGLGNPEGSIPLFNLDMPGVPGLNGQRTFYGASQAVTLTPGDAGITIDGSWLNVDDRAGFAVQGSTNPIQVTPTSLTLSAGPASGSAQMTVRALPRSHDDTRQAAAQPQPTTQVATLRAALIDDTLVLINLSGQPLNGSPVALPAGTSALYDGSQTISPDGQVTYQATLAAASGQVLAPRFRAELKGIHAGTLKAEVLNSTQLRLSNTGSSAVTGTVTAVPSGQSQPAAVPPGATTTLTWEGTAYPVSDLARGRPAYPDSPLPPGTTSPAFAIDGDDNTSWIPGQNGRMVVDLGGDTAVATVQPIWQGAGPDPLWTVSVSEDGLSFTTAAQGMASKPATISRTTRYVALAVNGDIGPSKGVVDLRVAGPR